MKFLLKSRMAESVRLLAVFFMAFATYVSKAATDRDAIGQAEHTGQILSAWLANHSEYREATRDDCYCSDIASGERRVDSLHSASGDFDRDGTIDYAYVVVNRESAKDYIVLVFASRLCGGEQPFEYKSTFGGTLSRLGLFTRKSAKDVDILLFGAVNSEAEPIHLPQFTPGDCGR